MDNDLYGIAMQVVPLLLIALFLGNQDVEERQATSKGRWDRTPDKAYTVLGVVAFTTSMFVVADVIDASRFTLAIVVIALSGCISLLSAQIWRRFDRRQSIAPRPAAQAPVADAEPPTGVEKQAVREADHR